MTRNEMNVFLIFQLISVDFCYFLYFQNHLFVANNRNDEMILHWFFGIFYSKIWEWNKNEEEKIEKQKEKYKTKNN